MGQAIRPRTSPTIASAVEREVGPAVPGMIVGGRPAASIQLKLVLVNDLEFRILGFLSKHRIPDDEQVEVRSHETSERVLGRADDRLAAHVEAGVDHHRTAGQAMEAADEI